MSQGQSKGGHLAASPRRAGGAAARWTLALGSACLVAVSAPDVRAAGPAYSQQAALAGATGAYFGYSIAIDGSTAVVGAFTDDGGLGAAYVYVRSGSAWSLQQELTAADGAAGDQFGYAVAVSGDTILVGAPNNASARGSVYAFDRAGTSWSQAQEVTAADGASGDAFGGSLALSGSTAAVGAPDRLGNTGATYVLTTSGGSWQKQQELVGPASGGYFGSSVAVSPDGSTVIVGVPGVSGNAGEAYVFAQGGGSWSATPSQTILSVAGAQANDHFGYAVGAGAGLLIVGAYGTAGYTGAAYVFSGSGTSWAQQARLTASDAASNDYFGSAVALSGGTAVVGAYEKAGTTGPGAAYVFASSGGTWAQTKLTPPAARQYLGYAVAVSGPTVGAGAYGAPSFTDAGAAYLFASASTSTAAPALDGRATCELALLLAGAGASLGRRRRRGAAA